MVGPESKVVVFLVIGVVSYTGADPGVGQASMTIDFGHIGDVSQIGPMMSQVLGNLGLAGAPGTAPGQTAPGAAATTGATQAARAIDPLAGLVPVGYPAAGASARTAAAGGSGAAEGSGWEMNERQLREVEDTLVRLLSVGELDSLNSLAPVARSDRERAVWLLDWLIPVSMQASAHATAACSSVKHVCHAIQWRVVPTLNAYVQELSCLLMVPCCAATRTSQCSFVYMGQ